MASKPRKGPGPWTKLIITGLFALGGGTLSGVTAAVFDDPQPTGIDCTMEEKKEADLISAYPETRGSIAVPPQVERQCHPQDFINSVQPRSRQ